MSLHPAFAGLAARMRAARDDGARAAFARQARDVAATSGHSLEAALALLDGRSPPWTDQPAELREQYPPAREAAKTDQLRGRVEAALRADPAASDRAVARALSCSPTIVGRVRKRLGLAGVVRTVRRGGHSYSYKGA